MLMESVKPFFAKACFCSVLFLLAAMAAPVAHAADQAIVLTRDADLYRALLTKPKGAPKASIILFPGGPGQLHIGADGSLEAGQNNQLVRTRDAYAARGFAVMTLDLYTDRAAALAYMMKLKRPVVFVATSRGTLRAAEAIKDGVKPDGLVLTAGMIDPQLRGDNVPSVLGSPASLPPTLVVHHRQDGCRVTLPSGVDPFVAWASGKVRKVVWLDGGISTGDPCQARSHHGFNGIDGAVVSAVASFAAAPR